MTTNAKDTSTAYKRNPHVKFKKIKFSGAENRHWDADGAFGDVRHAPQDLAGMTPIKDFLEKQNKAHSTATHAMLTDLTIIFLNNKNKRIKQKVQFPWPRG